MQFLGREFRCEHGKATLKEKNELVIGGDFTENIQAVSIKKGICKVKVHLFSDHEEADTRLLLQAKHASAVCNPIIIQSPDTDIAVFCVVHFAVHFKKLHCQEPFKTGMRKT